MSDLADDIVLLGISHVAVIQAFSDFRRNSTGDKPFLPATGEILKKMETLTFDYRKQLEQAKTGTVAKNAPLPEAPRHVMPWVGLSHAECKDRGLLDQIEAHIENLPFNRQRDYRLFLHNHHGFPKPMNTESLEFA